MQGKLVLKWASRLALGLAIAASTPAWGQSGPDAQPSSKPSGQPGTEQADSLQSLDQRPRPWAEGVTLENQQAAIKLFEEGNGLLRESVFVQAVAKYREALELWDHPGIHYNLSLALMNLDQPIEVYQSLEKALRYGPDPLGPDKHERAVRYRDLIEDQLARIEVVCNEDKAKVMMDGKPLFTAPGRYEGLVRVGEHSVVASKPGHITMTRTLVLGPRKRGRVEIDLVSIEETTEYRRNWAAWKPWSVAGAGAAVAVVGGILHWRSAGNYSSFDEQFNQLCAMTGCLKGEIPSDLSSQLDRAEWQQNAAVTSYVIGGTAIATGLVLVYVNRPRLYRKDLPEDEAPAQVSLAPLLLPDTTGVSAAFRF